MASVAPALAVRKDAVQEDGYSPVLSPKAEADLKAGLESAKTGDFVYRGSFAQFADDEE